MKKSHTFKIPESTRPIHEIIRDHVTVLPGYIGLELDTDTPVEEALRILDWTTTQSDNSCGYMIGDAVNFGYAKWGKKYGRALHQTGRVSDILQYCASMSALIPPDTRKLIGPLNLDGVISDADDDSGVSDWWK